MPDLKGIVVTRRTKAVHADVGILVFAAHDDDSYVFPLLDVGANGYALKTTGHRDSVKAIRDVHRGETALHPAVARRVVERLTHRNRYRGEGMVESLAGREMEVLAAVSTGWSNKAVSRPCTSAHTPPI
jgi:DNA-binding NarL/FixJ family response regulator